MFEFKKTYFYFAIIAILLLTNVGTFVYFMTIPKEKEIVQEACEALESSDEKIKTDKLVVDIKGCVKKPGVYELEEGAIVNDLIKKAGGLTKNGSTENINLSKKLANEMVIVISSKTELKQIEKKLETAAPIEPNITADLNRDNVVNKTEETSSTTQKISLNQATKEELMTLSGIGESKAMAILTYRSEHAFTSIEELKNVNGIGDAIYEKIKDFITI